MSRRERRSVSLGRHRDRPPRDPNRPIEEDVSTRHNISNFLLTLQRVQASEEENRQLRKENQLLRQRARSARLSTASMRGEGGKSSSDDDRSSMVVPEPEDEVMAAETKRNSLIFVGDAMPFSPEHAALEVQHKRLQDDFNILKEFLRHLFQHALTLSTPPPDLSVCKDNRSKDYQDVNTYNPIHSKQFEHSLEDIHGQISQIRSSQDQQQVRMDQVQQALDNVLSQSSVRNDVTMRLVRQQDRMKEMTGHVTYLDNQLRETARALRVTQEKLRQCGEVGQRMNQYLVSNNKSMKGNTREDIGKLTDELSTLTRHQTSCSCKMAVVGRWLGHVTSAAQRGESLSDTRPPAEVVECMSRLERLVGSDWHRLGRVLGLTSEGLDDIGKFLTNFDLTSRVEKVVSVWARTSRGVTGEVLRQALDKMDRDLLLVAEPPVCKQWHQLPSDVLNFSIAHIVDVQSLTSQMAAQGVIGPDTKTFILGCPQEHRRASRLLHACMFMGEQSLVCLCAALERLRQNPVADKIRGSFPAHPTSGSTPPTHTSSSTTEHVEDVWKLRSHTNTLNNSTSNNNNINGTPPSRGDTLNTSRVSSSSSSSTKSGEKERKKRSRSLFTRKSKSRDADTGDMDSGFQEDLNYHYPAVNMNASSQARTSRYEESTLEGRQGGRQYGRKNTPYNCASRDGVVV